MKKFNIHDWQAKQTKQRLAENNFMIKILLWVN